MTERTDEGSGRITGLAQRYTELARLSALMADEWDRIAADFATLSMLGEIEKATATAKHYRAESARLEEIASTVRHIAKRAGVTP